MNLSNAFRPIRETLIGSTACSDEQRRGQVMVDIDQVQQFASSAIDKLLYRGEDLKNIKGKAGMNCAISIDLSDNLATVSDLFKRSAKDTKETKQESGRNVIFDFKSQSISKRRLLGYCYYFWP